MKFKVTGVPAEKLAERVMFMAWQACGGTSGLGFLRDRGPDMSEEGVLKNVRTDGDYAGGSTTKPGELYGDYVFGRMMKTGVRYTEDTLMVGRTGNPDPSYQGWARKYKTYDALVQAAASTFTGVTVEVLPETA